MNINRVRETIVVEMLKQDGIAYSDLESTEINGHIEALVGLLSHRFPFTAFAVSSVRSNSIFANPEYGDEDLEAEIDEALDREHDTLRAEETDEEAARVRY